MATDAEVFAPEIFSYEAFNGRNGAGLTGALRRARNLSA
jgi:hypothetical protein